jgi:hypothetical protein
MAQLTAQRVAIEVFRQPLLVSRLRRKPLPDGMLSIIQIAANGLETNPVQRDQDDLHQAAIFFLQQVLSSSDNDNFRQLGLNPGASLEVMREHRRWLLKWLHPDRNRNKWESNLFTRVTTAAAELEKHYSSSAHMQSSPIDIRRHKTQRKRKFLHPRRPQAKWKNLIFLFKRVAIATATILLGYLALLKFGSDQFSDILTFIIGRL